MNRRPKILILGGSIRSGSYSQQLADAYASKLAGLDCMVTRITLTDYSLPIMDEDLQKASGIPDNAVKLARLFHGSDAVVIVTPEYNGSLPPLLKNAIDWISRVSTNNGSPVIAYRNKLCAIASTSAGLMGGVSALGHLRDILVRLGMLVISEQLALGHANKAFDPMDQQLLSDRHNTILTAACTSLVEKATLLG